MTEKTDEIDLDKIEALLRDNNLSSIWARDEVRPSMEWLISEIKQLRSQLEIAKEGLSDIANRIHTSDSEPNGGPDRMALGNDRNARILKAKETLEKIQGISDLE